MKKRFINLRSITRFLYLKYKQFFEENIKLFLAVPKMLSFHNYCRINFYLCSLFNLTWLCSYFKLCSMINKCKSIKATRRLKVTISWMASSLMIRCGVTTTSQNQNNSLCRCDMQIPHQWKISRDSHQQSFGRSSMIFLDFLETRQTGTFTSQK